MRGSVIVNMAAARNVSILLCCLLGVFVPYTSTLSNFKQLHKYVSSLETKLNTLSTDGTRLSDLQGFYNNNNVGTIALNDVAGAQMVSTMSQKLQQLLKRKMDALKNAVKKAEELAAKYQWNSSLKKGDVEYISAKDMNPEIEAEMEYSTLFKQKVNLTSSSVHIPVEIFDGDIEILNGLKWSEELDRVWTENREKDPTLLWQYFGSQRGFMRTLPASKWRGTGVDLYDVRRRPWYTQGASSPKDMLIIIDTSGSTHGQALQLMKVSVKSLLDTLGENDFVNVVKFSKDADFVSCYHTFVQANHRHKKVLFDAIDKLSAQGMANFTEAMKFGFEQFEKFRALNDSSTGQGAQCNEIIMFLTDGGTEMPEDIFRKYNWPDKKVRVFTYMVGPQGSDDEVLKEMACSNRGYFSQIPAMGAIRSTVQGYLSSLSMSMSYFNVQESRRTGAYPDHLGLGMMTTVTLPVYNRTAGSNNQTILGVMGSDVTTKEMEDMAPKNELGPNGYSFAINTNGYIVFHPHLKAQVVAEKGWLKDPPNMDFLEVEFENAEKLELRKEMINDKTGSKQIKTFVEEPDERYVVEEEMTYYYTGIPGSSFSLGMAIPVTRKYYLDVSGFNPATSLPLLEPADSMVLLPEWDYCRNLTERSNVSSPMDNLLYTIETDYTGKCDAKLMQHVFWDATVTKNMDSVWTRGGFQQFMKEGRINSVFVATESGVVRVYPKSSAELYNGMTETVKESYYRRALNKPDTYLYGADYHTGQNIDVNATAPLVTIWKAVSFSAGGKKYTPAVVGMKVKQMTLLGMMNQSTGGECNKPDQTACYIVDEGGFLIASNQEQLKHRVGQFLGDVEVDAPLMSTLVNQSFFNSTKDYDFEASCLVEKVFNAGPRSFTIPSIAPLYDVLNLRWWTTNMAWAYFNFNFYTWLFPQPTTFAHASGHDEIPQNRSCTKLMHQYYVEDTAKEGYIECGNCSRKYMIEKLPNSNLLLVLTDRNLADCEECDLPLVPQRPQEVDDPESCQVKHRYRKRPDKCYDQHPLEDNSDCGTCHMTQPSMVLLFITLLAVIVHNRT